MARFIFSMLAVIILFGTPAISASVACDGTTLRRHSLELYDFSTNSSRAKCPDTDYFCFYTCYRNHLKDADIRVHWYIPDHSEWVPASQETLPRARYTSNPKFEIIEACLEYGNTGRTTRAPLVAREGELNAAEREKKEDCKHQPSIVKVERASFVARGFKHAIEIFFPSDAKRPQETMLRLKGEVGIQLTGDKQFKSYLSYFVERFDDRKLGTPEGLTLRPRLRGDTEYLIPFFSRELNDGFAPLDWKGFLSVTAPLENVAALESALIEVANNDRQVIATFHIPVFVR